MDRAIALRILNDHGSFYSALVSRQNINMDGQMKRIYNRQKAEFIPSPSQGENNIRKRGRGSEHEEL